ncbi:MAG: hypothetical protein P4L31_06625 [Candidatus Babeliales bacterium]|nr:hypothetical protein [Candidatus Babeliales bacterium]
MIKKMSFMAMIMCAFGISASLSENQKNVALVITVANQNAFLDQTNLSKGVLMRVDQTPEDKVKLARMGLAWLITQKKSAPIAPITSK